ncbi:uncharacterized protein LOC118463500 [Anopheles albimanus]|uniref:Uncharacterized protein n=1 Tax=Anopheles albimanus TaxID=7167 RepID=A0A182FDI9_ANOAL|nr:uncharacterized protein LOC118463500 [Anopheles albimanus]
MSERNEDIKEEDLGEYDRYVLEQLVVNDWGLSVATLNRMIYCGVNEMCLHVIEDAEISELFNDSRMLGQKIMFKHRLKQWRLGELFSGNHGHLNHATAANGVATPANGAQALLQHHHQFLAAAAAAAAASAASSLNGTDGKRSFPCFSNTSQHLPPDDDVISVRTDLCGGAAAGQTNGNGTETLRPSKRRIHDESPSSSAFASAIVQQPPPSKRKFEELSVPKGGTVTPAKSTALGDVPVKIDRNGLLRILQSSQSGRSILTAFQPHEPLDRRAQTIVTHCIVDQFLQYNILFKHRLMSHYAEVITELFPAETKEVYYAPRNTVKRNTSGKLFDRYTNQRLRHKDRLPRVKPFVVDEWSEHKTFEQLAIINEAAQLNGSAGGNDSMLQANGSLIGGTTNGSAEDALNGGFAEDYSNGGGTAGDENGSDDGHVSTDFLQPLATMFVEGEQPLTSNGTTTTRGAVNYSTREEVVDD